MKGRFTPSMDNFAYMSDSMYFKKEILYMKVDVLNYLKFEFDITYDPMLHKESH